MQTVLFELHGEYIPLCNLLKSVGLTRSGGQAKHWITEGKVTVDGMFENRKTAKIRVGQIVICENIAIVIRASANNTSTELNTQS